MKTAITVCSFVLLLIPTTSFASPGGLNTSIGGGISKIGSWDRQNTDCEVIVFYELSILKLDLGINFDLEDIENRIQVRPGARLTVPLVYARFALPFNVYGKSGWDFLVGIGREFDLLDPLSVFVEINTMLDDDLNNTPLEARLGIEIDF